MTMWSWFLVAAATVQAATIVCSRVEWAQSWIMLSLSKRVGLGVPDDLDPVLRSRVALRMLSSGLGGLAGLAVATDVVLLGRVPIDEVSVYACLAASWVGSAFTVAVVSLASELRQPVGAARVARAKQVVTGDYVPGILRVAVAVLCLFALGVVACVLVTVPAQAVAAITIASIGILGLVALVGFEVAARRLVGRGQPAASTDELVWDDALRSVVLRDLLLAPVQLLGLGALFPAYALALRVNGVGQPLLLASVGVFVVAAAVFRFFYRDTRRWYLETLWRGARRRTDDEEAARVGAVGLRS